MELHTGSISVHSEGEGHGCTFTVKLPMHVHQQQVAGVVAERGGGGVTVEAGGRCLVTPAVKTSSSTGSSHSLLPTLSPEPHTSTDPTPAPTSALPPTPSATFRLLVVDDSQMNRKMIVRVMKSYGHQCEEAEDGVLAVDAVTQRMQRAAPPYDAILMDFMMPNLDGPGATKAIRAMGYTGKIYGLTGNVLQQDIDHFLSSGADSVLHKPLDMSHFHQLMDVRPRE